MTDRLALPRRYRDQLEALLGKHVPGVEVWAYGSRVNGESHEGSDLDLVLRSPTLEPLDGGFYDLREAIEKSNIPILIQAHDWASLPETFHREIERGCVVVQEGAKQTAASGWREVRLGDVMSFANGTSSPERSADSLYPVYGSNGIIGKSNEVNADANTIVIGRVGSYCGSLHFSNENCWITDNAIRAKAVGENDSKFFLYLLQSLGLNEWRSGSGQPLLNQTILSSIPIALPPHPTQRTIAHVLGTLDDKIELNRRMNETLEAMARALFKSWFVDFEPVRAKMEGRWRQGEPLPGLPAEHYDLFPDRLVDSELGEIPEGWEVRSIEEVSARVAMGPFGSSIKVSTFVDSGIPVISGQHLRGTLLEDGDYRFITEDHAERLAKANVQRGDIVFTHAGNIGQVAYIPVTSQYERYVISQRQFYLRCDPSKISPLFVVHSFKTLEGQHLLLANTSSTGVPSIARPVTYLRSIRLCIPSQALWKTFHDIAKSFYLAVGHNTEGSHALVKQRDALLPKLVSGRVGVERRGHSIVH